MRRFESLDVVHIAAQSMRETKQDFLEWQKEQMFAGKKRTGGDIRPFYKPATVRIKRKKGQPYDRVTLEDTGFFQSSIFFVVKEPVISITSSDVKSKHLEEEYGPNIFGLGGVFKVGYIQDLRPVLMSKVRQKLKV